MTVIARFALCLLLASAVCLLPACAYSLPSTKPTPPRVSDCLDKPAAPLPPVPLRPPEGAPIPAGYVQSLEAWINAAAGIATVDRLLWAGANRCIRKMQDAGQVR